MDAAKRVTMIRAMFKLKTSTCSAVIVERDCGHGPWDFFDAETVSRGFVVAKCRKCGWIKEMSTKVAVRSGHLI